MQIKLIVIRTNEPEKLANFYSLLGLVFEYHQHGNSPFHYSAVIGETVLEIYPLAKNQTEPDKHLRLGFTVDNFEQILEKLRQNEVIFSAPTNTAFGFLTLASDPDGRKIEIYRK